MLNQSALMRAAAPTQAIKRLPASRTALRTADDDEDLLTVSGVRIPFNRQIITPPIEAALRSDRYEEGETRSLPAVVRGGDRVLELGAGIGFVSTILANRTSAAKIVAVEANPELIPFIRKVHRLNGAERVTVMNGVASAGDAFGVANFYARRDFWMSSLSPEPYAYEQILEVPVHPFDALIARHRINMIVCDIEGGEVGLLPSAVLGGVDRIYAEVHDHLTGLSGVKRLFDALSAKGFAYDLPPFLRFGRSVHKARLGSGQAALCGVKPLNKVCTILDAV